MSESDRRRELAAAPGSRNLSSTNPPTGDARSHRNTRVSAIFFFSQAAAQGTSRRGSKVVRELPV
jgi:hypothetical protein